MRDYGQIPTPIWFLAADFRCELATQFRWRNDEKTGEKNSWIFLVLAFLHQQICALANHQQICIKLHVFGAALTSTATFELLWRCIVASVRLTNVRIIRLNISMPFVSHGNGHGVNSRVNIQNSDTDFTFSFPLHTPSQSYTRVASLANCIRNHNSSNSTKNAGEEQSKIVANSFVVVVGGGRFFYVVASFDFRAY